MLNHLSGEGVMALTEGIINLMPHKYLLEGVAEV